MADIIGAPKARWPADGVRESRPIYDEWLASGEPFDANAEELDKWHLRSRASDHHVTGCTLTNPVTTPTTFSMIHPIATWPFLASGFVK